MKPTEKQIASAIKKYNDIMWDLCREHLTIGTELSEHTEEWNLRDLVAECDYQLSTYYESGHVNCDELKHDDYKTWRSETGKLKRFIAHWEPYIDELKCSEGHCSKYDD